MTTAPTIIIIEAESLIAIDIERVVLEAYPQAEITLVTPDRFQALQNKDDYDVWIVDVSGRGKNLPSFITGTLNARESFEISASNRFLIASRGFNKIELLAKPYDDSSIIKALTQLLPEA